MVIEAGNIIPADLRLLETAGLRIGEAALTGESEPVDKTASAIDRADLPLGDRSNLAFSGTQVALGRGLGVVVATGMATGWPIMVEAVLRPSMLTATRCRNLIFWKSDSLAR